MKVTRFLSFVTVAMGLASVAQGQSTMGGQSKDLGEHLAKLFSRTTAFSANADMSVKDAQGKEVMAMQSSYALLAGNVRTETDMATMRSAGMPPEAAAQMKQMGMDRIAHLYLAGQQTAYLIYPGLQAYCELKKTTPTTDTEAKEPTVGKTELGKDTVDGHPCVKYKILTTYADGSTAESTVWQATDLKDFPIKSEIAAGGGILTTIFKNINQSKPPASLFELPAGYTSYGSVQEMVMGSMKRMMPPEATPNPHRGAGGSE